MPAVGSSSPWSGCQDTCGPSPVCVHLGVHPTRSAVRGPGVQPSGVQPVQCPIIWLPRPDAAVRPAGVQPVRGPAVWCPPVRPVAAVPSSVSRVVAMGTLGTAGQPCGPASSPAARSMPEETLDAGTAAEVVCRPVGECRRRTWAGVCSGGRLHPADQASQTAARVGRRRRPRSGRELVEARRCRTAPCGRPCGLESRLLSVVVAEPYVRVDGPEGPMSLTARISARPQRGPARWQAPQARRWQRRDLQEWWWARQGLNL